MMLMRHNVLPAKYTATYCHVQSTDCDARHPIVPKNVGMLRDRVKHEIVSTVRRIKLPRPNQMNTLTPVSCKFRREATPRHQRDDLNLFHQGVKCRNNNL